MARSKPHKLRARIKSVQQPTSSTQGEMSESYDGFQSDGIAEKDEFELELERRIFGDDAGFLEGLTSYRHGEAALGSESADEGLQRAEEDLRGVDDADLFFLDSGPPTAQNQTVVLPESLGNYDHLQHESSAPLWVDSDDERIVVSLASDPRLRKLRLSEAEDWINGREYTRRLRQQFERLYPVPQWANPPPRRKRSRKKQKRAGSGSASSDTDGLLSDGSVESEGLSAKPLSELLQNTSLLLEGPATSSATRRTLRAEVVDVQRSKDVGNAQASAITSLEFHPVHPLLLSSGPASTLYLHHISPNPPHPNPLLTSLHVRHTPIATSTFEPTSGFKILFSGRRRYFHTWNLSSGKVDKVSHLLGQPDQQRSTERFKVSPCGRWIGLVGSGRKGGGVINVLNAQTSQWVAEARVEGKGGVADFTWWGDGEGMTVLGKGGEAIEWSGRGKRVVARWIDEGAVGTSVVALGGHPTGPANLGGDRWVAVGSSSGIVNIYDRRTWEDEVPARPNPSRTFDQLVTPTSHLKFSRDGQVLCMASRWKRDALRLVHLPSLTVYRNWPTSGTPLGRVSAVAWSPSGVFLAVGNEQGKIRLWEIRG